MEYEGNELEREVVDCGHRPVESGRREVRGCWRLKNVLGRLLVVGLIGDRESREGEIRPDERERRRSRGRRRSDQSSKFSSPPGAEWAQAQRSPNEGGYRCLHCKIFVRMIYA